MKIAVIGAGTLGCGWVISFARAGYEVRLYDEDQRAVDRGMRFVDERLPLLARHGLIDSEDALRARVLPITDLREALSEADYLQENIPEVLDLKRSLFASLDQLASEKTILASSTSGMAPSRLFSDVAVRDRCIVVHPLNPPYLNPAVEVVRSPWTSDATAEKTRALMETIGQVPIMIRGEGKLVLTRLQAALLAEACWLVEEGSASVEDIDKAVRDGLGLRYAFMGPFETMDLNAPGGIADFMRRYGPMFTAIRKARHGTASDWSAELIETVENERRSLLPLENLGERSAWRDERLMEIAAYKRSLAKK